MLSCFIFDFVSYFVDNARVHSFHFGRLVRLSRIGLSTKFDTNKNKKLKVQKVLTSKCGKIVIVRK